MRLGKTFSLAVAILASSTAFAGTPGWSISESSGQVSVLSTGLVKAAVRGGTVATGDIINTGRNGRAVLVRGEEYLVVSPNTRIRVADPARSGGLTQIIEDFGNVIYKIKKMTMPHFAVETPFLAAVVKGTTFSVTVTEKGASVQVTEGRVEVATRDGGASFMVLPGDIGSVSANAPGVLNMQGRESRSISSPTPAAASAAVTASVNDQAVAPDRVQMNGKIESPVDEGAVDLAAMSDGMVSGDSSMKAMTSMMKMASMEMSAPAPMPAGAETGTSVVTATTSVVVEPTPTALPPVPAVVVGPPASAPSDDPTPAPAPAAPVVVASVPAPAPASLPPAPAEAPVVAAPPAPAPVVVAVPAPAPAPEVAAPPAPIVASVPAPAPLPAAPAEAPVVAAPPAPAPVVVAVPAPAQAPVVAAPSPVVASVPAPTPIAPLPNIGNNNSGRGNANGQNGSGNGHNGNGNGNANKPPK